jgi:hypothetical protein
MSIPKIIHYCWFGYNPLPPDALKCIRSWKKYCPDYQIIQWTEDNFDVTSHPYMYDAWKAGKWAFVSDYARLKIIAEHGGIYLDTDVELIRSLDPLLEQEGFMGYQDDVYVATGLGFGAVKGHPVITALLEDYDRISFLREDGSFNTTPCPELNLQTLTRLGLQKNNGQIRHLQGITLYPPEYFCPVDYQSGILKKTKNTYSIHHFTASWMTEESRYWAAHNRRKERLRRLLGPAGYRLLEKAVHILSGKAR